MADSEHQALWFAVTIFQTDVEIKMFVISCCLCSRRWNMIKSDYPIDIQVNKWIFAMNPLLLQ